MSDSTSRHSKTCHVRPRPTSTGSNVTTPPCDTNLPLAQQADVIGRIYAFALDDANTFLDAQGRPDQIAMRLTHRTRPAETLVVVCKAVGPDLFWYIQDMQDAPFEAGAYIAAVEQRIARNKAQRNGY